MWVGACRAVAALSFADFQGSGEATTAAFVYFGFWGGWWAFFCLAVYPFVYFLIMPSVLVEETTEHELQEEAAMLVEGQENPAAGRLYRCRGPGGRIGVIW